MKVLELILLLAIVLVKGGPWTPENAKWNLNQNKAATEVKDYAVDWPGHIYFPSPENWRIPFYTVMPDRYADGDPTNNQVMNSDYEWDPYQVNFHFGGDMKGLSERLDYLSALGIKGLYVAGTPFVNLPWDSHYYNPIDLTIIDPHLGTLEEYRQFVDLAHKKGFYIVIDLTISTMGDLLQFDGFVNVSAPLRWEREYTVSYKSDVQYNDFKINNTWNPDCDLNQVKFYNMSGDVIDWTFPKGCFYSEFDQYGDLEAFGNYDPWKRILAKFAGVQDRLKDWIPSVADKLTRLACLSIEGLDIDGIRVDKVTQMTVDFVATHLSPGLRQCAAKLGKKNFFVSGEVTANMHLGTHYIGRGRNHEDFPKKWQEGIDTKVGQIGVWTRDWPNAGVDSCAFHYSIYRGMLSFLGLRGNLLAPYDVGADPVEAYNDLIGQVDYTNAITGKFDPRDLWGVGNQDTFRWASLDDGITRFRLGQMVTTVLLPGAPNLLYGDEQAFILHDSRAENYIYGRQPMTSAEAWQLHGCYKGNASYQFIDMPFSDEIRNGCKENKHSLDHFDMTNPSFLFTQHLYWIYQNYPIFTESFRLDTFLRKEIVRIENNFGQYFWSVSRSYQLFQNFNEADTKPPAVWYLFSNSNSTITITNSCSSKEKILTPAMSGLVWQDVFPPYEVITTKKLSEEENCLDNFSIGPYGFRVLIEQKYIKPRPSVVTSITPSHDNRILRTDNQPLQVPVTIQFTDAYVCNTLLQHIKVTSYSGTAPTFQPGSIKCNAIVSGPLGYGIPIPTFQWSGLLVNVPDGITKITIEANLPGNPLLAPIVTQFRVGLQNNVLVFTKENAYSTELIKKNGDDSLQISHSATGADLMRYSVDFGVSWTSWVPYTTQSNIGLDEFNKPKSFNRLTVMTQYWCSQCGSPAYIVTSEVSRSNFSPISKERRQNLPSLYLFGEFNLYGNDKATDMHMSALGNNSWEYRVVWKFPTNVTIDRYGDFVFMYGDVDGDGVLDRLPPNAQDTNSIYLRPPPFGYTGWIIKVDDSNYTYSLEPYGSLSIAIAYYILIAIIPLLTGLLMIYCFWKIFYKIVWNRRGRIEYDTIYKKNVQKLSRDIAMGKRPNLPDKDIGLPTILIASLEYEIPDWSVKVRIGGLGVITSLMGNYLQNNIIWLVPMVGDIKYPECEACEPIIVTIYGKDFAIGVYTHTVKNVKYILLDAGIFKTRTRKDPYTAKMDDLESAVFYSAWNQCIAEVICREDVDIYHINDFHGALAPLYLLPNVVPCALSLHNAEFQGLWPVRTDVELARVCSVFHLPISICRKYIQYGNTFNLLHAASMYLSLHQKGYGAGGVSDKYGERCHLRYPTLWCLHKMVSIQNPNPADIETHETPLAGVTVGEVNELKKMNDKLQSQKWADLDEDPDKILFVFVGRWSRQKGIDLIADLAPKILETYSNSQIICVGPVIDLYGHLAAIKLSKIAQEYPGRVYCKPEFSQIPNFVFRGCDFVLLPSRDEPFGLVAVEFGRNGVLGIGSFVGGLGTMPGWWFPIESSEIDHLLNQFWKAIKTAMSSTEEERRAMIHTASRQRFPVAEWKEKLCKVYDRILKIHNVAPSGSMSPEDENVMTPWRPHTRFIRSGLFDLKSDNGSRASLASRGSFLSLRTAFSSASVRSLGSNRSERSFGALNNRSTTGLANSRSPFMTQLSLAQTGNVSTPLHQSSVDLSRHYNQANDISNDSVFILRPKSKKPRFSIGEFDSSDGSSETEIIEDSNRTPPLTFESVFKMQDIAEHEPYKQYNDEDNTLKTHFQQELEELNVANSLKQLSIAHCIKDAEEIYYDNASKERLTLTLSRTYSIFSKWCQESLQYKIRKWPIYGFLLALGQLLSASSFQLVLLTDAWTTTDMEFNVIGIIFIVGTLFWWTIYRKLPSVVVCSFPMFFYALAMFLAFIPINGEGAVWTKRLSVWVYTFGSGSGSLYFALNFGEEAGVDMTEWIFRAGLFEGIRQIWTMGLWYWSQTFPLDSSVLKYSAPSIGASIGSFIGALLLIFVGVLLYFGLPSCYHHSPPFIPGFYSSFRYRGLAIWFLVAMFIQAYWLSGPYGRNWTFLWNQPIPDWQIALMILLFVVFWIGILRLFWVQSQIHSWIFPVFAAGLLSPRWAQMSWSTSNVGYGISYPGTAGPYFSLGLWLWLGVLDACQSVGLSMMLLQTLTRVHVGGTLMLAQIVGAIAFILARATAPNSHGPGDVFPDPSTSNSGADAFWSKPFFWIGLFSQIIISLGYLIWFRREQLSKP